MENGECHLACWGMDARCRAVIRPHWSRPGSDIHASTGAAIRERTRDARFRFHRLGRIYCGHATRRAPSPRNYPPRPEHMTESSTKRPRFSLIIPARNEEAYLPRLLDTVDVARNAYHGGPDQIEVVVADNVSTDATAEIARQRGCRVVRVETRNIGAVRNSGIRASIGEIVTTVDADARIHAETFNAVDETLRTGRVIGGATGVTLERWSLGIRVTYAWMAVLVWLIGIDTGLVFCAREDFDAVGGYNEKRRFAEDVEFLWQLRRLGRSRGQKLARVSSAKAIYSTRKFDLYGDWHYFRLILTTGRGLFFPAAPNKAADEYWYSDRR